MVPFLLLSLLTQVSALCSNSACNHFQYCPDGELPFSCPKTWASGIAPGPQTDPISIIFLQCLEVNCRCDYVPLSDTCETVQRSGVTVGMGLDLQFIADEQELLTMGVSPQLAKILSPLAGPDKGDPIKLAEAHPIQLTQPETDELNAAIINGQIAKLTKLYDENTKGDQFMELPKGIRTALFSFYQQDGGDYERNADFWEAAFSQDWAALIKVLKSETTNQSRRQGEVQIISAELHTPTPNDVLDLVLAIDGSGSIDENDFATAEEFLVNLIRNLKVDHDNTQVAFITFSSDVNITFYLDTYGSAEEVIRKIQNTPKPGGGTSTGQLVETIRNEVLIPERGRREGVASCMTIVLTDGRSSDYRVLAEQSPLLKDICTMLVIGIGDNIDQTELSLLASQPNFLFVVPDFSILLTGIYYIRNTIDLMPKSLQLSSPYTTEAAQSDYVYFSINLNLTEFTVRCIPSEGDFIMYGSLSDPNPSEYSNDFIVKSAKSRVMRFQLPPLTGAEIPGYAQAYVSLQGKESSNSGTIEVLDGLFCANMKAYSETDKCPDEARGEVKLLSLAMLIVFLCSN